MRFKGASMFIFVLLSEDQARFQASVLQSGLSPFCGTNAALGKLKPDPVKYKRSSYPIYHNWKLQLISSS